MLPYHAPRGVESPSKGAAWLLTLQNYALKEISSVSIVVLSLRMYTFATNTGLVAENTHSPAPTSVT